MHAGPFADRGVAPMAYGPIEWSRMPVNCALEQIARRLKIDRSPRRWLVGTVPSGH